MGRPNVDPMTCRVASHGASHSIVERHAKYSATLRHSVPFIIIIIITITIIIRSA